MCCRCGDGEAASSFYFVVGWETKGAFVSRKRFYNNTSDFHVFFNIFLNN
jgi:hypothetical protein